MAADPGQLMPDRRQGWTRPDLAAKLGTRTRAAKTAADEQKPVSDDAYPAPSAPLALPGHRVEHRARDARCHHHCRGEPGAAQPADRRGQAADAPRRTRDGQRVGRGGCRPVGGRRHGRGVRGRAHRSRRLGFGRRAARRPGARSQHADHQLLRERSDQPAAWTSSRTATPTRSGPTSAPASATSSGRVTALAVDGSSLLRRHRRRRRLDARSTVGRSGARSGPRCPRSRSARCTSRPTTPSGWAPARRTLIATPTTASACYRSTDFGTTWRKVGGSELFNRQVFRLVDDGAGHVYAATSQGLYRHADNTLSGVVAAGAQAGPEPDRLAVQHLVHHRRGDQAGHPRAERAGRARLAQRHTYNGFYLSTTGGGAGLVHQDHPER